MRKAIIIIFVFFSIQTIAQNFSTINFVTNKCSKNVTFAFYLNEQMIGSLGQKENLEYKIFSEGRISLAIIINSFRITRSIDIKKGNTYYFEINNWIGRYELVDATKGQKYYSKNSNTLKAEEDKKNPISKSSPTEEEGPKQGTCFLIGKQGYLMTNYHVISGAKTIQIKGIGNDFSTLYAADVINFDVDLDLALLKLKNKNIVFDTLPYKLSPLTSPQGSKSFVLGFPLTSSMGEEIKVTEGLVSAKSGYKGSISQYQISAQVQPGNSGSPLFNENGDIIGIINAKLQGAEGAGYAIKSQYISTFLKLIDNIQIENNSNSTSKSQLIDKISKLKSFIFIVKTE